jgi:hypothetical protein
MPLLDHFHGPIVHPGATWTNINAVWTTELTYWLNQRLPAGEFTAVANVRLGAQVEADVAEFELGGDNPATDDGRYGPVPPPVTTVTAVYPDVFEVQVQDWQGSARLAGVIELVSPGNKKEANERDAFVSKCEAYLRQGAGLVVVDVVTSRLINFHNALMDRIGTPDAFRMGDDQPIYVAGYRPGRRGGQPIIDAWPYPAEVGRQVPSVPFCLRRGPTLTLDLEGTYMEARRRSNL